MSTTVSTRVQDESHNLWHQAHDGCMESRNVLIERNLPLVRYVVGRLNLSVSGVLDYEDLVGFGQIGLIDAVSRYDPGRGTAFSTYAIRRIRGAIMDELRALDWAPRSVRSKQRIIQRAFNELSQQLHRDPSLEEVSARVAMSPEEIEQSLEDVRMAYTSSLDEPITSGDDGAPLTRKQHLEDPEASPEAHGMMLHNRQRIAKALPRISSRARTFFGLYYFENRTLSEISVILGVTESRVCQVHTSAMRELRSVV